MARNSIKSVARNEEIKKWRKKEKWRRM